MDHILPDPQQRAERASRDLKVNEIKLLGMVAEDPLVCYTATMQKFKVEAREETTQVTVIATTLLKSKVVQLYLFAPYAGGTTIAQLLAKQRTNWVSYSVPIETERWANIVSEAMSTASVKRIVDSVIAEISHDEEMTTAAVGSQRPRCLLFRAISPHHEGARQAGSARPRPA